MVTSDRHLSAVPDLEPEALIADALIEAPRPIPDGVTLRRALSDLRLVDDTDD